MSFFIVAFLITALPSGYNIGLLFAKPLKGKKKITVFVLELICIAMGLLCTLLWCSASNIRFSDWFDQIYVGEQHSPILTQSLPTFITLIGISVAGFVLLRLIEIKEMPPLCSVLCISAMYLGVIECILWCIQISKNDEELLGIIFYILPVNLIIIFARTIRDVVLQRLEVENNTLYNDKLINCIINNAKNWPWVALILTAPLLGVIVVLLLLFGQRPDYIVKMWTETADWTFSSKIPPESLYPDGHYLCTVAANGHKQVVKPVRTGIRHGHRIVVNRQLMVANAFEQLIEERTPRFHKVVRTVYNNIGYPISKHIKTPFIADMIYFIMKPLEWLFLIVLYLFDKRPENRIAVQYPHSELPVIK